MSDSGKFLEKDTSQSISKSSKSISSLEDFYNSEDKNKKSLNNASEKEQDYNIKIGSRIKSIRLLLGFTQSSFSELMNVTFQQVQKYEKGFNRVSAIALWNLSEKLGMDISYFFPQKKKDMKKNSSGITVSEKPILFDFDKVDPKNSGQIKEISCLLDHFRRIESPKVRKRVISLVQTIVESEQETHTKLQKKEDN